MCRVSLCWGWVVWWFLSSFFLFLFLSFLLLINFLLSLLSLLIILVSHFCICVLFSLILLFLSIYTNKLHKYTKSATVVHLRRRVNYVSHHPFRTPCFSIPNTVSFHSEHHVFFLPRGVRNEKVVRSVTFPRRLGVIVDLPIFQTFLFLHSVLFVLPSL